MAPEREPLLFLLFYNDLLTVDNVEALFSRQVYLLTVQVVPLVVADSVMVGVVDDLDASYYIVIIIGILHVGNNTIRAYIRWVA